MSLSLAQKLSFRLATGWQQRTMARAVAGPVLSIGFDDAPRSAWTMGGQVLADHGVRATYYVCGGLVDTDGELGTYLTRADLRALVAAGHELGCHTFDHSSALLAGAGRFAASLEENARWLADFTGGVAPCSFAYPYCHVGLAARRAAGARFHTARAGG
ncbi:MAG TPA: polysaccharide deacetylase family protein, partial [Novosphingobium sp.]|nr:polysaccharide deacetylase family protein [Novosphingobium sp.]